MCEVCTQVPSPLQHLSEVGLKVLELPDEVVADFAVFAGVEERPDVAVALVDAVEGGGSG